MLCVVPLWSDEILNGTTLYAGEPLSARQKKVELLSPHSLSGWDIPSGDYSGITPVSDNRYAVDDKALLLNPLSEDKVVDKAHNTKNGMSVMVGGEYRKGKKRVQGVFGFGLLFAFQNDKTTYSYGNQMTEINQTPSVGFSSGSVYDGNNYRLLKTNGSGSDFYTGVTGSAGIEWFVAPKISLGAEVNLSLYYIFGNQDYTESEGYNPSTGKVETRTDLVSPRYRELYIGTESLGGSLNMTFYF